MQTAKKVKPERMLARGSFGKYKKEDASQVRELSVKLAPNVEKAREAWKSFELKGNTMESEYDKVLKHVKGIDCTPEEVQRFAVLSMEFQEEQRYRSKLGLLLSALINSGTAKEYCIDLKFVPGYVTYFGMKNIKDIKVHGRLDKAFELMEYGKVEITGRVKNMCYGMQGGEIVATKLDNIPRMCGTGLKAGRICIGSVKHVGQFMEGGTIHVLGDVINETGNAMRGGEIIVEWHANNVGKNMGGGKIEVKQGAAGDTGMHMYGGLIRIYGSVFGTVGGSMDGGQIHLETISLGNPADTVGMKIESMFGGMIYAYDKVLSVRKGQ